MTESPNPNIVDADTITGEMHPIRRAVISIGSNEGLRTGSYAKTLTFTLSTTSP